MYEEHRPVVSFFCLLRSTLVGTSNEKMCSWSASSKFYLKAFKLLKVFKLLKSVFNTKMVDHLHLSNPTYCVKVPVVRFNQY